MQLNIPRDMFYGDVEVKIKKIQPVEISAGGANDLKEAAQLLSHDFPHDSRLDVVGMPRSLSSRCPSPPASACPRESSPLFPSG